MEGMCVFWGLWILGLCSFQVCGQSHALDPLGTCQGVCMPLLASQ